MSSEQGLRPAAIIRLLRPRHWVKNAFVAAPLVFALRLTDGEAILSSLAAIAAFCLTASAVYIVNDIADRERDRLHPTKRNRPIAAGTVSIPVASAVAVVLTAGASTLTVSAVPVAAGWIAAYLVINLLYTGFLKRLALFDVLIIAVGFVIRVEAGSAAIGEATSSWMILTTLFIALFLGLAKRRGEEANLESNNDHRPGSAIYTIGALDILTGVSLGLTVIAYALYTVDPQTIARFGSRRLVYTVPIVIYALFRYFVLVTRDHELADPTEIVTRDLPIIISVLIWIATIAALVYGPNIGWFAA